MNYLAHGRHCLDDPYELAGTAVPDWLNVSDRPVRVRSKHARPLADDADPRVASVARGIVRHHADDAWFHQTRAFAELSLALTVQLRRLLSTDDGFRPSFLGHILVEVLLDAELARRQPGLLDDYYRALARVDGALVQATVNRLATRPADRLAAFIGLFVAERFLYDYADDGKLWFRLNQVMSRVGLPALPEASVAWLAAARRQVSRQADALLAPHEQSPLLCPTGIREHAP